VSNPTSNFGWQMPQPTDLVTDLPADFEVFGQAVDTSLADLKGGTSGQILAKNSNTDMDFVWVTNDVGDITAVTAGTGITGGGTSGAVTITNDMATTITTNGDLIYGTGSGTYTRRGIGSTGQVLTVSGGVPAWETPSSGTPAFVGCSLTKTAGQSVANNTLTTITWDSETFDTDGFHDNVTNNSRITIPSGKAGKYLFIAIINWNNSATGYREVRITKNGTAQAYANFAATPSGEAASIMHTILNMSVGDYVDLRGEQTSGGNLDIKNYSIFQCQYLGA